MTDRATRASPPFVFLSERTRERENPYGDINGRGRPSRASSPKCHPEGVPHERENPFQGHSRRKLRPQRSTFESPDGFPHSGGPAFGMTDRAFLCRMKSHCQSSP